MFQRRLESNYGGTGVDMREAFGGDAAAWAGEGVGEAGAERTRRVHPDHDMTGRAKVLCERCFRCAA